MKVGVDVGGTNTDGVLLDLDNSVLYAVKKCTTPDVKTGIQNVLNSIVQSEVYLRRRVISCHQSNTAMQTHTHTHTRRKRERLSNKEIN